MLTVHIHFGNVTRQTVGYLDTDDTTVEMEETVTIPVCIPASAVSDWLAAYDSSNQYSPTAGDSRLIARAVLDALKKHEGA